MHTSNFEGVKVALKQDRTGYVLTLSIHPDDLPEEILRDFVGSRYQVVMVRLNNHEQPMNRKTDLSVDPVQMAGILCRDKMFGEFLVHSGNLEKFTEQAAADWLREFLGVPSRAALRDNPQATKRLVQLNKEFHEWKKS